MCRRTNMGAGRKLRNVSDVVKDTVDLPYTLLRNEIIISRKEYATVRWDKTNHMRDMARAAIHKLSVFALVGRRSTARRFAAQPFVPRSFAVVARKQRTQSCAVFATHSFVLASHVLALT